MVICKVDLVLMCCNYVVLCRYFCVVYCCHLFSSGSFQLYTILWFHFNNCNSLPWSSDYWNLLYVFVNLFAIKLFCILIFALNSVPVYQYLHLCLFSMQLLGTKSFHLVDIFLLDVSLQSQRRSRAAAFWWSHFLQRLVVCIDCLHLGAFLINNDVVHFSETRRLVKQMLWSQWMIDFSVSINR